MSYYRGTIYKRHTASGRVWTNSYTIFESSALEALDVLNAIEGYEKAIHYDSIVLFRTHVINKDDKTDARSAAFSDTGELNDEFDSGELPLFNTVRVTLFDTYLKPEQKYLRLGATETDLTLGQWSTAFQTIINTNYVVPLLAQPGVVGPSGEGFNSALVHQEVQNRQLGWHRRTRPGFHRGWVPN